jgi:hypothetical protein
MSGILASAWYPGVLASGGPAEQATWTLKRRRSRLRITSMWMNVSAPGSSAELMKSTFVLRPGLAGPELSVVTR